MKSTILSLALALGTAVSATLAVQTAPKLAVRDTPTSTFDCNFCTGMLNFCVENGRTKGQEGCKQSCRKHVCHRTPECKKCHGEFDKCPEKSRYLN